MYKPGTKDTAYCLVEKTVWVKVNKLSSLRPSFLIIVMILNGVYQRFRCLDVSIERPMWFECSE